MIATDFYRILFSQSIKIGIDLSIDKSIKIGKLHQKLHRRYFKRAAGLDREKLVAYKPDEDFKPGFEEKIRIFRFF